LAGVFPEAEKTRPQAGGAVHIKREKIQEAMEHNRAFLAAQAAN